jgi:hypothetical protein
LSSAPQSGSRVEFLNPSARPGDAAHDDRDPVRSFSARPPEQEQRWRSTEVSEATESMREVNLRRDVEFTEN